MIKITNDDNDDDDDNHDDDYHHQNNNPRFSDYHHVSITNKCFYDIMAEKTL